MTKEIRKLILTMVAERPGGAVDPTEIARAIAGSDEKQWRLLMTPIRREATKLAVAKRVELRRKGRRIEPGDLRGVYRIAAPSSDDGPGNSESVLPVSR